MVGQTIGHYKVLRQIGVGGMGEVYAAEDLTLNREVALKLLPAKMADDAERRERFEREAKVIAALDHPNIVTIHSIEHAPGSDGEVHFITMQLVVGKTLGDLIPAGGFSVDRFFELAIPLAEAVSVAHEHGITHRDLKPGNVMVAEDGRLKVLDFGLAKLAEEPAAATEPDMATVAETGYQPPADLTEEGKVLGTVAYMSPEQAEGKVVDHRSDIFSLGIILYQMASGEAPFRGDTKLSIMSSIVKETPTSITELNARVPRHLGRILRKCLEKDPRRRYQSTLDLRNDLEDLKREYASGEALPVSALGGAAKSSRPPWLMIGAVVVVTAIVAVLAAQFLGGDASVSDAEQIQWRSVRLTNLPGVESDPDLSPDGGQVVFVGDAAGNQDIYLQRVGGSQLFNLTEGSSEDDSQPAYSPDGDRIAFRSNRDGGGIYLMGATGENVRRLVDGGYFPSWSPDGASIAYGNQEFELPWQLNDPRRIMIVDVATRESRLLTGEGMQPDWSPNGQRIAYFGTREGGQRDIFTIAAGGGDPVDVTSDEALDWSPQWSPDGRYLYFASNRGGTNNIWRVAIDETSGAVRGAPEAITTGGSDLQGYLSIAADGRTIAFAAAQIEANVVRVGFDGIAGEITSAPAPVTSGPRYVGAFDVSADDSWVVFRSTFPQEDLILIHPDGSGETKLTDDADRDRSPRFSPDGERVYFYSDRSGTYQIWSIRTDGTELRRIAERDGDSYLPIVSPDGSRVAVSWDFDTAIVDLDESSPDREPTVLPRFEQTHALEVTGWSPDGDKLAGSLMTAEQVREFIGVYSLSAGEFRVFRGVGDGGRGVAWLGDSRRLAYIDDDGSIALLDTQTGEHRELLSLSPNIASFPRFGPEDTSLYFIRESYRSDIHMLVAEDGGR